MTVAWFSRALQTGSLVDWVWCVVVAAVALLQLLVVRDGRAPLMVADEHGVRVRHGETWSGLRWQDIENVEVTSPTLVAARRPGRRTPRVVSAEEALLLRPTRRARGDDESPGGAAAESLTTEAYVVPLARTTRVEFDGLSGDLVADLDALASGRVPVLVLTRIEPEKAREGRRRPEKAEPRSRRSRRGRRPRSREGC